MTPDRVPVAANDPAYEPKADGVLRLVVEDRLTRSRAQSYIASRILIDLTNKCFVWTKARDREGYALCHFNGVSLFAHRLAYAAHIGPIPDGLVLDHLCRNHGCVNAWHLEPVTLLENVRRGREATKTHCRHGHEYVPENTYRRRDGTRDCRKCIRDRKRKQRAKEMSS